MKDKVVISMLRAQLDNVNITEMGVSKMKYSVEERPTGEWITDEFGRKICGKCQFPFAEFQSNNYCSLCGADMRKGEEE